MKILKNMHPTDKEALTAITVLLLGVVFFVSAFWLHAIATGQC
jgi:hypothetical protein